MANNRYFMRCDCGSTHYLGKSLGTGIYTAGEPSEVFGSLHEWMWQHLLECEHPKAEPEDSLGPEWVAGEIFTVITEYDDRAPSGRIPPYISLPQALDASVDPWESLTTEQRAEYLKRAADPNITAEAVFEIAKRLARDDAAKAEKE